MKIQEKINTLKKNPLINKRLSHDILDKIESVKIDDKLNFNDLRTLYIVVTDNCLPGVIFWTRKNNFDRGIERTPRELIELLKQSGEKSQYSDFENWFLENE